MKISQTFVSSSSGDDIQRWWDCDQRSINQQTPSPHLLAAAAGGGVAEAIKIKNDGAEKLQGREKPAPSDCVCAVVLQKVPSKGS